MTTPSPLWLVYDGDCPFCAATAKIYRLKKSVGVLHIVNAREAEGSALMAEIRAHGLDLNEGIVARFEGRLYHGADALHLLALLGSDSDLLNRFNAILFRNRQTVRLAYPIMKAGRAAVLGLMGRKRL